jgi:hypothetical protein
MADMYRSGGRGDTVTLRPSQGWVPRPLYCLGLCIYSVQVTESRKPMVEFFLFYFIIIFFFQDEQGQIKQIYKFVVLTIKFGHS